MRTGDEGVYTYASKAKAGDEGGEVAKDIYRGAWNLNQKHGIGK